MKKELLALVFKTTNYARDLNIGETVLLTHRNGRYILSDGVNTYGEQITTFDESADNLLSYVADKRNIHCISGMMNIIHIYQTAWLRLLLSTMSI